MDKREEFLKKIRETFRIEAEENISSMTSNLIEFEKNPSESRKTELIEIIFRQAHSLKGASRAVNITEIESVCQSLESVFSAMKNKIIELVPKTFNVLHQAVDILNEILFSPDGKISTELKDRVLDISLRLSEIEAGKSVETKISKPEIEQETTPPPKPALEKDEKEKKPEPVPQKETVKTTSIKDKKITPKIKTPSSETIRISVEKLDNLLYQVEEMLSLKLTTIQRTEDLRNIIQKLNTWNKEFTVFYPIVRNIRQALERKQQNEKLSQEEQNNTKIIKFYEWANSHIKTLEDDLVKLRKFSDTEAYSTGAKIETLLEDVKKILSVPFSSLLSIFPKAVRDLSHDKGKDID